MMRTCCCSHQVVTSHMMRAGRQMMVRGVEERSACSVPIVGAAREVVVGRVKESSRRTQNSRGV